MSGFAVTKKKIAILPRAVFNEIHHQINHQKEVGIWRKELFFCLQGRIVNNNTVPSGGPVSPPQVEDKEGRTTSVSSTLSSTVVTTPWSLSSPSASSENLHQNNSAREYKVGPTQFLIHEEGGLERWFNLTITNVGLESVADYTCVAVNAGGVMEEAITLTFEEPEPVSIL